MRTKIYCLCAVLLMVGMPMSIFAQVQEDNLVGRWRFNDLKEETGNWGDIVLEGATIEDGQLVLNDGKWAHAIEYNGPDITELTLVVWVSLDNLDLRRGSALTLDKLTGDQFCGIVYAERQARQWMPGSSHFRRTHDFPNIVNEDTTGEMNLVAIAYKNVNNRYEITGYRNDKNLGTFKANHAGANMDLRTWPKGDAEAIWGTRHTAGTDNKAPRNFIAAHLEEARIYNVALTADEVMSLHEGGLVPVEPQGKLATQWGALKSK